MAGQLFFGEWNAAIKRALPGAKLSTHRIPLHLRRRRAFSFCKIAELSVENFFAVAISEHDTATKLAESDLLAAFFAFFVKFARSKSKINTAQYAFQVISTVRSYYADLIGRRPGWTAESRSSERLESIASDLQRLAPRTPK